MASAIHFMLVYSLGQVLLYGVLGPYYVHELLLLLCGVMLWFFALPFNLVSATSLGQTISPLLSFMLAIANSVLWGIAIVIAVELVRRRARYGAGDKS